MIRLSGHEPGVDIPIVYTGLRPGEKLHEELFHASEDLSPTGHEKLLLANHSSTDAERIMQLFEELRRACDVFDEDGIRRRLIEVVPELLLENGGSGADEFGNVLEFNRSK